MKVLWFTPVPLPAFCQELGLKPFYGGGWVLSMLSAVAGRSQLEIAVAWAHRNAATRRKFTVGGVHYYQVPDPGWLIRGGGLLRKVTNRLEPFLGHIRDRRAVAESAGVVADYGPDLIHVFGAEHCYGLVAPRTRSPTVVWIQGILDVYQYHYFGSMSWAERLRYPNLVLDYFRMKAEARREREIYHGCRYFIGRTGWDAAHQARLQSQGRYYTVQDCMRPEFYTAVPWRLDRTEGETIYTTTSGALLKGTDSLIRAVAVLRKSRPRIRLRVAGVLETANPVARRLFRLVKELDVCGHVEFLGQLDAAQNRPRTLASQGLCTAVIHREQPKQLGGGAISGNPGGRRMCRRRA